MQGFFPSTIKDTAILSIVPPTGTILIISIIFAILLQLIIKTVAMSPAPAPKGNNNWFRLPIRNKDEATISNTSNQKAPPAEETKKEPQYFAGQFEYEVSPRSSPTPMDNSVSQTAETNSSEASTLPAQSPSTHTTSSTSTSPIVITERMVPVTKTIYLIRHAESDENRRLASLSRSLKGLVSLKIPAKDDLVASSELLHISAQIDSDVSPKGRAQINQLGRRLMADEFVVKMGIQLVAHSPLKRARSTSEGMLRCVSPNDQEEGCQAPSVTRVVELDLLSERTPMEWLPIHHDAFTKRIANFEQWLSEQPEDVIAIVGHSQYFKSMLGLNKKFKNCDVWSLQFDYHSVEMTHKGVKHDVRTADRDQAQKKMKRKIKGALQHLNQAGNNNRDDNEQEGEERATKKEDDIPDEDDDAKRDIDMDASVYEDFEEIYEIDGVRVDDVELPRGWRDLKRHYTFDPSLEEGEEKEKVEG